VSEPRSIFAAWRWWLGPTALALALAFIYRDPFIGDWDALDYTVLSLRAEPSSMALGRSLFIFSNHALWRMAHAFFALPASDAYLLFKYAVIAQCPLAVLACWTLARDLTRSVEAATIAALLVATSPAFVVYGGQVMTEIPSLLLVSVALTIHLRGIENRRVWMILVGAAVLGMGVNVRETVAFYAPWLVLAPFVCGPTKAHGRRRRAARWAVMSCLVFAAFAFGPFVLWFMGDDGFRASWYGWRESMRMESARHPVAPRNLFPFLFYFFLAAPPVFLTLPYVALKEWRERGLSCLLAMALVGLLADCLLIFNYSTVVNWRYFLTGLPALAPLVAVGLLRWRAAKSGDTRRAFLHITLALAFATLLIGVYAKAASRSYRVERALTRDYRERLMLLPRDGVVIAGGQTVAVTYYRGIGEGAWEVIGTGGGWPGEQLVPLIERYLQQGRPVFLDRDTRFWSACGWQLEETRAIAALESRFHFRRISDTIFELRPATDETAHDDANLKSLLPENRPAEVRKCTSARMKVEG
jgi:hypothetical protein